MNPQYVMHQQQYGAPPPQGYNQNRPSPSLTPQSGFQNVPLGPPPKNVPVSNGSNQQSPVGQPNHIPNSYLPPPPVTSSIGPSGHYGPPQPHMGASLQGNVNVQPPSNFGPPPSRSLQNLGGLQPQQANLGPPPQQQLQGPPQLNQGPPQSNIGGPPPNFTTQSQQSVMRPPPSSLGGQSMTNLGEPLQSNLSGPPQSNLAGPPQPNIAGPPHSNPVGPPHSNPVGPPHSNSSGPPHSNLVGPPHSNPSGPPHSNPTGPPQTFGGHSNFGGPPANLAGPPPSIGGPQTNTGGPQSNLSQMGGSQPNLGSQDQPEQNSRGPPSSNFSGPPSMNALRPQIPSNQLPPGQQASIHKAASAPLMGGPQDAQNPLGPPLPVDKMNRPNMMNGAGFAPPPLHQGQQYPGQKPPMPGPHLSQPPQPGQPLLLGQNQFGQPSMQGQIRQPPLPGQQNQFNQPPGQYNQFGQQQITNQMQGMNISGPRQYPGVPQKQTNGDGGASPHMPPPMSGQGAFVNGQQMRAGPQAPGYPPMPGQTPMASGPYAQAGYQQAQQTRRLDPDQMPNPIQVTQDDQRTRSGVFVTNQKGLVPPLVSTNFIVQDQGNTSPRYIRSTMYNVPITQDLMKQSSVPFGLVISPMARTVGEEYPPPIVNFGDLGPVRCIRCKAYMCPFMQFIDSGRRFQCLFCKAATEVSNEYFQHLDHTGQRVDRYERPELVLGTYELTATPDYCRNNVLPKPPAIIFVIDVSYNNIKSGLVNLLCSRMKEIIQNLPVDQGCEKSNMRVGFITYNSSVHFYNIKGSLAAPQMLVVGDTQEMFMPLLDGFLCTPEESSQVIDLLMEQIPVMFGGTRETETVLLPAILAGLEALKASECAGKLLVFHSTLPIAEAPGKLKNRDDRKLLGTDKEKTVLTPQTQAYNQLGQDCVQVGCCVDLFLFNNAYIDIATIGQVARLSGGEVYKYTYFQADLDGERVVNDIIHDISRPIAFDAIMRVRTSTGVRPTDFYGHFFMSNTTDMELAAIDCDKAVAVEVKHDDKLSEEEGVYIQVALLYTSCSGQRRLRVMNLSLKTCSQMSDLYRSCDLDTLINFQAKQSVYRLLEHNPKAVKDGIVSRAAQILANYRKNCASPSSAGQLILPECMKLLPLYVNCLLKSDALSGGSDITLDDRSFVMQAVMTMDVPTSVIYFYPRLIPLHEIKPNGEPVEIPATIRCTIEKMSDQGVYILENGIHMFLWVGLNANPEFIQQVFGVPSAVQVDIDKVQLPVLDNKLSQAVRSIIEQIQNQKYRCMRLTVVRQREKLEPVFKHFLVEDRGADGSPSYVDFLCHMHKEIRTLLS